MCEFRNLPLLTTTEFKARIIDFLTKSPTKTFHILQPNGIMWYSNSELQISLYKPMCCRNCKKSFAGIIDVNSEVYSSPPVANISVFLSF